MIIQAQFDFEAEEVEAVMEAICIQVVSLVSQPKTSETIDKLAALRRFTHRIRPIIDQGITEAMVQSKAQLN